MKNLILGVCVGICGLLVIGATSFNSLDHISLSGLLLFGTNNVPSESAPDGSLALRSNGQPYIRSNGVWSVFGTGGAGGGSGIPTVNGAGTNTIFWDGSSGIQTADFGSSTFLRSRTTGNNTFNWSDGELFDPIAGLVAIDFSQRTLKDAAGASVVDWTGGDGYTVINNGLELSAFNDGNDHLISTDEFGHVQDASRLVNFHKSTGTLNATSSATTDIFVIPGAQNQFILTSAEVYVVTSTFSVPAQVKIICTSGDMTATTTLTGTTVGKVATIFPLSLTATAGQSEDHVSVVVTGGVGGDYQIIVTVNGYYQ